MSWSASNAKSSVWPAVSGAMVRLAAAAFAEAEELGLERSTRALQIADEAIGVHGPDLLPTKALIEDEAS